MEGASESGTLAGWEIHGFRTMEDLDTRNIMKEATSRWLRPNEIHAVLCNYKYFSLNLKPVNLPKSGAIILFNRKILRNFRKDGHNWKKKKDGKTVKEAHEHLKIGNEERIHVYYAHGQDQPTFVRRCYWLLDKTLEHILLVHYRETQEFQSSKVMPVISNSTRSDFSDRSTTWDISNESNSVVNGAYNPSTEQCAEPIETIKAHEMRLREINTLEWDDLLASDDPNKSVAPGGEFPIFLQQYQGEMNGYRSKDPLAVPYDKLVDGNTTHLTVRETVSFPAMGGQIIDSNSQMKVSETETVVLNGPLDGFDENGLQTQDSFRDLMNNIMVENGLQTQDIFRELMNNIMVDSPGSVYDPSLESSTSTSENAQSSAPEYFYNIKDISPSWSLSTEETKIIVLGFFSKGYSHLEGSNVFCVCGNSCVPAELVQTGVYRCLVTPHNPGLVNFYLSCDGQNPISQTVTFEYRSPLTEKDTISSQDDLEWDEFQFKVRLAHLLFSTTKSLHILSTEVPERSLLEAKLFAQKTTYVPDHWAALIKSIEENQISFSQAKDGLFELILQNRLHESLLERITEGSKISEQDDQGQGVIHLCAMLGYTWAVYPFSWSGMSLDYRDKSGWTALHWAAYHGREKMVAALLSAGAKPNLVTDPTSENRAGRTAADLASLNHYDGLAAYLAEKALIEQFKDMTVAGYATGSLQNGLTEYENPKSITEEEGCLKETLSAYRTAADAAARIQAAIREHSLKLQTKAALISNSEDEVRCIIAAMKIQHAFRNHDTRKKMAAAVRIQYRFRTWKIRNNFVNVRRHAIRIQAVYRGFQVRRQYRKIVWSVGVVEKAILRWRLKRKGFRGLKVDEQGEKLKEDKQESDGEGEEYFFKVSRKQAEERVERSVIKVQAMFRSKRAQEEYRTIKLAHDQAKLEYKELSNPPINMEK